MNEDVFESLSYLIPECKKNTYHVVWMIPERETPISTGRNYEAIDMRDAYTKHMRTENVEPLAILLKS